MGSPHLPDTVLVGAMETDPYEVDKETGTRDNSAVFSAVFTKDSLKQQIYVAALHGSNGLRP